MASTETIIGGELSFRLAQAKQSVYYDQDRLKRESAFAVQMAASVARHYSREILVKVLYSIEGNTILQVRRDTQ